MLAPRVLSAVILIASALLFAQGCQAPDDHSLYDEMNANSADRARTSDESRKLNAFPQDLRKSGTQPNELPISGMYGASAWDNPGWAPGPSEEPPTTRDRAIRQARTSAETPVGARENGGAQSAAGIPVLCYHQVEPGEKSYGGFNVSPERFEEQLRYLKSAGYESLSQAQLIDILSGRARPGARGVPARGLMLTFDDGLISHYTIVAPLLKRYGFRGTLFLYPTVLSSKKKAYMNWDQARELLESGVFEVGSHSLYHPFLPEVSPKELDRQMRSSREILERKLNIPIRIFAYPFGVYDRRVIDATRAAGYELAFTIHTGVVRRDENRLTLNRYMVTRGDDLKRFRSYLRLEAPRAITLQPADGSHVSPGEVFTLYLPDVRGDSVRVRLGKTEISMEQRGAVFRGRLPDYKSSRGYLPLEV
ncbi:MAG: polysaccharide deacetylase family protein, partial [Leptospirales bacterium]